MVNELNKCSECTQCPVFETMVSMHVCQQCANMPRLSNLDRARAQSANLKLVLNKVSLQQGSVLVGAPSPN